MTGVSMNFFLFCGQSSRQHFLDRIVWCLQRLQSTIDEAATTTEGEIEGNFVTYMDMALVALAPLGLYTSNDRPAKQNDILSEQCAEVGHACLC